MRYGLPLKPMKQLLLFVVDHELAAVVGFAKFFGRESRIVAGEAPSRLYRQVEHSDCAFVSVGSYSG